MVIDTGKFSIKEHLGAVLIKVKPVLLPPSPVNASAAVLQHSPTLHAAAKQLGYLLSY
jgi:hypothetical protein